MNVHVSQIKKTCLSKSDAIAKLLTILNHDLPGEGMFDTTLEAFCPQLRRGEKIIQPNLVTFPENIQEFV